jgi:hypothetical protein
LGHRARKGFDRSDDGGFGKGGTCICLISAIVKNGHISCFKYCSFAFAKRPGFLLLSGKTSKVFQCYPSPNSSRRTKLISKSFLPAVVTGPGALGSSWLF